MNNLIKYLENVKQKLTITNLMVNVIGKDRSLLQLIVSLNTQDQLYNKGIRSDKTKIGQYAPYTIEIKRLKGQPYNHITLKDTGDFYDSFVAFVDNSADIQISSDPIKTDALTGLTTDLTIRYGEKIIGLTEENIDVINKKILLPVQKYIKRNIFK